MQQRKAEVSPSNTIIDGVSGRHYLIEKILQEKGSSPHRIYLARYVYP